MRFAPCVVVATLLLSGVSAQAQSPGETPVVLRISRDFVHQLIGIRFQRDQPVDANEGEVAVQGSAHVAGKFDVTLHKSENESDFDLTISGEIQTQLTATRRPVVVGLHGAAPFEARRRIVFDGHKFTGCAIQIDVANRFEMDDLRTARGRSFGPVIRSLAGPIVRKGLQDGDRQAETQIRTEVAKAIEEETDKLLKVLNRMEPAVVHAKELLAVKLKKKGIDIHVYRAATSEHLLLGIGGPKQTFPRLPELLPAQKAPVELWIDEALVNKDVRLRFLNDHWKDLKKEVHDQLVRRHPAVAAAVEKKVGESVEIDIVHVPGTRWHVVTFKPRLFLELPVITLR